MINRPALLHIMCGLLNGPPGDWPRCLESQGLQGCSLYMKCLYFLFDSARAQLKHDEQLRNDQKLTQDDHTNSRKQSKQYTLEKRTHIFLIYFSLKYFITLVEWIYFLNYT